MLDDLREVYERVSVAELFPEAKKNGVGYKMLCPFHAEKTPSFVVYSDEKRFHCFGCDKSGDYADYVKERGWASDFKGSANYLRKMVGMEELGFDPSKNLIYETNKIACNLFQEQLLSHQPALDYLIGRGITTESIKKYKLGFSGERNIEALKGKGISVAEMRRAGLVLKDKDYELFRNRIMFPIMRNSKIIAFAGRVMDDSKPKYINSPNTAVFHKGSTFYGLQPKGIKSLGFGINVEGYLDVIAMDQAGFDNAFAPMGTALTAEQVKEIKRHTSALILLNDGDKAGNGASKKSLEDLLIDSLLKEEMNVRVAQLPEGEDPHSLITKKGEDSIIEVIDSAIMAEVYLVKQQSDKRLSLITKIAAAPKDVPAMILPYLSDSEKALIQELSAKRVLEMLKGTGKLLYKEKDVEVRIWFGLLLIYKGDHFLLWQKTNGNPNKQAYAIAKQIKISTKSEVK